MKLEADLHMHTIASGHAYSTVTEMAMAAAGKGIKLIAITDHGPLLPGGPHDYYFGNLKVLPDYIHGVRVLKGVEANIKSDGSLDLDEDRLNMLDFVAAGIHYDAGYYNKSSEEHTTATIEAIKNPFVQMITHPANLYYPVDMTRVVEAAAKYNVILEVNASSFDTYRIGKRGSVEKTVEMCKLARQHNVKISINSDAHFYEDVGNIKTLTEVIEKASITEKDIINSSMEKVESYLG